MTEYFVDLNFLLKNTKYMEHLPFRVENSSALLILNIDCAIKRQDQTDCENAVPKLSVIGFLIFPCITIT